ncbi:MAG: DnaJ domain-containing protein [Deltaproteobacteria bacterium]|nr:DnaJ domain-containing protein [Deltaproteobacteria bacterium]
MTGEAFEQILERAMRAESARRRAAEAAERAAFEAEYALPPPAPRRVAHGIDAYRRAATYGSVGHALRELGLDAGASIDDIKRAFRRLAFERHPDRGGSMAAFVALEEAYRDALRAARHAA